MSADDRALDLVGRMYESALDPAQWVGTLERLGDLFGQAGVGLALFGRRDPTLGHVHASHMRSLLDFDAETRVETLSNNPLIENFSRVQPGVSFGRRSIVSDTDFEQSAMYQLVLRPQRLYHSAYTVLFSDCDAFAGISLFRPQGVDDFAPDDLHLLDRFVPHLAGALQLGIRLNALRCERDAILAALDRLPQGTIVVDGHGRVVLLNRVAAAIVAQADGLTITRGTLHGASADVTAALARLIVGAASTGNGKALHAGGALTLPRPSRMRPLELLVAPLPAAGMADGRLRPAAVIFVSDPERAEQTSQQLLVRLFGLTAAEARLAAVLLQGHGLQAAAIELHVGLNTARTHAKNLFAKTGVRRQSELIRLLLRSPAGIRFE